MSDTASLATSPKSKAGRCCGAVLVLLGLILIGGGGYALHVRSATRSLQPLPFRAFKFRPLERSILTAKFEFLELPSKLLGSTKPIELRLDERELNALLFGEARHTDDGEKARVTINEDRLVLEFSKPTSDGESYLNVTATLQVVFLAPKAKAAESVEVKLLEGQVGQYTLGPLTRPWVETALRKSLNEKRARDSRLARIQELSFAQGRARIRYTPN